MARGAGPWPEGTHTIGSTLLVLAAYEARADRNDWRSLPASTGRYLGSLGYVRADVERRACGEGTLPGTD